MANLDAAAVAQRAVKLGLIAEGQLADAWEELGQKGGEADPLLRVLERKGHLTQWQSAKLVKGELDGYFLGGFRILYKIASGSFGRVYRGDDPNTHTIVAIKVLRRKWSEDKHAIELFEREGKLGMSLHHPNIVEILAVNRDPASKQYYLVMEFVEGGNLREILNIRKKFDPLDALKILEGAAGGLAHASSRGISHRDMKLTNILISSQGHAKLVDFGLAGVQQIIHREDKEGGQVDRTVDYAGLEKLTAVPTGDARSDIYFLGCVAYEMLTGRSPLDMDRSARRRMDERRYKNVKPMATNEVNAPPMVFRLVETMMALDPKSRYQTAAQALDAVREVRRELEGAQGKAGSPAGKTIFLVETDERLQDKMREKFKELGYRVLLAADPVRALDRFRQQPYQALIIDGGTVGEDGLYSFERIMREANSQTGRCVGILILSEDQKEWLDRVEASANTQVLVRPVTMKQLYTKIGEMLTAQGAGAAKPPA